MEEWMSYLEELEDRDYLSAERSYLPARAPSPGVSAVLSVLLPGLGQLYAGRLLAGAMWCVGTAGAYWAILLPGFIVHALCVWSAYGSARDWRGP
jgi:TM2 domain-containing membrane protein YozV